MIRLIILALMLGLLSVPAWTQQPPSAIERLQDMSAAWRVVGQGISDFVSQEMTERKSEEADKAALAGKVKWFSECWDGKMPGCSKEADKAGAEAQIKYWSEYARGDDELVKYWSDYARGLERMTVGVVIGGQSMPVEQVPPTKPPGYNFNLPTKLPAKP